MELTEPAGSTVDESRTAGSGLPAHGGVATVVGTVVVLAVAVPALSWLRDRGLVLGDPLLLALLLGLSWVVTGDAVQRWIGGGSLTNRPAGRLALALALCAAVAWTAGWSPLVPLAAVLAAVVHVERSGSRAWRTAASLTVAVTVLGQTLVQTGALPNVPGVAVSHAVAGAALLLGSLTVMIVGISVASRERFEVALARTEARARALLDSSDDVLTVSDAHGVLTYVSPAAQRAVGHSAEGLVGRRLLDLVDAEHAHRVRQRLDQVVARGDGALATFDVLVVHASHERRWYEWNVRNLLGDPLVEGLVVDQRDVTERLLHSEALAHAAAHDDLTGLPNRRELMRRLAVTLPEATPGSAVAVLFLDLDRFKEVNDTLGHAAGDDLLAVVARRLRAGLRPHDHLGRLGGDEFCAVLTEVRDAGEVRSVVARLEHDLTQPVALAGRRVRIEASIGVAMTTDGEADPEALFAHADAAMYRLKNSRRTAPDAHRS
jgi:diguanylate cyclase (GGDEF)-like protein/PAS domain S-box-containing protein